MCPDIDSYEVHNDPYWFLTGSSLVAVVNSCTTAKLIESTYELNPWNDDACETDQTTFEKKLEDITFEGKIFQQTFNPTYYLEHGTTDYLVS